MRDDLRRRILDTLWPANLSSRMSVLAILDAARDKRIFGAVDGCYLEKQCLYSGDIPWQLQMTAPYLVTLERDNSFTRYLIDNGWGNSWGIFLRTETSMKELRRHLRGFLRVRGEAGQRLIFRYYDPRVMRVYLPTCRPAELEMVFGPVESYLMEAESGEEVAAFRHRNGTLIVEPAAQVPGQRK
jgi:hypothetical protein